MEIYVRHQSGPSSILNFHLSEEQRLKLIAALACGESVELATELELSVLQQWVTDLVSDNKHVVIPLHQISFNVDPMR